MARPENTEENAEDKGGWPTRWTGSPEERRFYHGTPMERDTYFVGESRAPDPQKDNHPQNRDTGRVARPHASCGGIGCAGCTEGIYWYQNGTSSNGARATQESTNPTSNLEERLRRAVLNGVGSYTLLPNGIPGVQIGETIHLFNGAIVKRDETGRLMVYKAPSLGEGPRGVTSINQSRARQRSPKAT